MLAPSFRCRVHMRPWLGDRSTPSFSALLFTWRAAQLFFAPKLLAWPSPPRQDPPAIVLVTTWRAFRRSPLSRALSHCYLSVAYSHSRLRGGRWECGNRRHAAAGNNMGHGGSPAYSRQTHQELRAAALTSWSYLNTRLWRHEVMAQMLLREAERFANPPM